MKRMKRRQAIFAIAGSAAAAGIVGCESKVVDQAVSEVSTPTLEETRIGLRGFQIIAFTVGNRIVRLPHPAVRILGVALLTSGIVTFLVVEYLDVELRKRSVREELEDRERSAIEAALAVEFTTENGFQEQVALGPNRYEPGE